jgi:hypothetical protein
MPDLERRPPTAEKGGRGYLVAGAVVVAALVGAYVLIGTPGLHQPVASAPGQAADVAARPTPAPGPVSR